VTPLLLRAVAEAPAELGAPLEWVAAGRLGVWVTRFPESIELGRDDMLAHHVLVERICDAGACLPVRLGSWTESDAEARALLDARADALLAALDRVRGRVELAVACLWRAPAERLNDEAPERSGRAYLERRRREISAAEARERRAEELRTLVEQVAGASGADAQHRPCPSESIALSSALLVIGETAGPAADRLRVLAADLPDVDLVVNGPWPPYSFAGI
jgi:hypothetical protein